MKRTLAYNRYPLVICALGLLLGGLHSLFQLHQTPADTWIAAYLTAREGTELMLTENSTDPQVLRSLLHLLIGVPLLGGLFSREYQVKGVFIATRRGRYLRFYRAEMGRLLAVTLLYNLLYCSTQGLWPRWPSTPCLPVTQRGYWESACLATRWCSLALRCCAPVCA